jgi:hypothetical protein
MVNFDQISESAFGILPGMARFWGDPADGEICDVCGKPITKQQLVTEGFVSTLCDKNCIQFHVRCFQFGNTEGRAPKSLPSPAYSVSR